MVVVGPAACHVCPTLCPCGAVPVVVVKFPKEGERDTLAAGPSRKIVAAVDESAEVRIRLCPSGTGDPCGGWFDVSSDVHPPLPLGLCCYGSHGYGPRLRCLWRPSPQVTFKLLHSLLPFLVGVPVRSQLVPLRGPPSTLSRTRTALWCCTCRTQWHSPLPLAQVSQ